ncbi:MAG: hypothetical protein JOZ95_11955 [Solirubrobacterales bacterium]|nr:hypothetical protein [Solirubrobacterales bacterium]MBV8991434.1 hypothetical protein [Solirubrobacterales bacterium]
MSLWWITVLGVIASGCVVAAMLFWFFWKSSQPEDAAWTDASWSVAAGLLGFEATFAAMFVSAGLKTVLWAVATALALGMIPAYIAAVAVEASPAARRRQQRHQRHERPPLRYRVAVTIVVQCALLAAFVGKPTIILESAAALSVLWAVRQPGIRAWCETRWSRVEDAVCLVCVAAAPFVLTPLLAAIRHPHIKWAHWAPGVLASVSPDSFWIVLAVVAAVAFSCRGYLRGYICASSMPLLTGLLVVVFAPAVKTSPSLAIPAAQFVAIASVCAATAIMSMLAFTASHHAGRQS